MKGHEQFADQIDDSLEGSLSEEGQQSQEDWVHDSKWPHTYLSEASDPESPHQEMLQSNLSRMFEGASSIRVTRRGAPPAGEPIVNGSLNPGWRGRGYGAASSDQEIRSWDVPIEDIVGVGHSNEGEVFFKNPERGAAQVEGRG